MVYVIVNKTSKTGKGAGNWNKVKDFLIDRNIKYTAYQTKYKGHASVLAKQISRLPDEDITILVLGGDGTVNEVVNGITDFDKVSLAVVPCGSGNDFAKGVGISKDIDENLERIFVKNEERAVDLGLVRWEEHERDRIFTISSGVGMDAIVCKKALTSKIKTYLNKVGMGKLTYIILTILTLLQMEKIDGEAIIDGESVALNQIIFSAAMNLRAEGGGVPMAPKAELSDGKLDVCAAYRLNKYVAFLVLPILVLAKHEKLPCFFNKRFEEMELKLAKPFTLHADGEYCGEVKNVRFRIAPFALRLRGIE